MKSIKRGPLRRGGQAPRHLVSYRDFTFFWVTEYKAGKTLTLEELYLSGLVVDC